MTSTFQFPSGSAACTCSSNISSMDRNTKIGGCFAAVYAGVTYWRGVCFLDGQLSPGTFKEIPSLTPCLLQRTKLIISSYARKLPKDEENTECTSAKEREQESKTTKDWTQVLDTSDETRKKTCFSCSSFGMILVLAMDTCNPEVNVTLLFFFFFVGLM